MAALTVGYVALAFLQDQGSAPLITAAVVGLAAIFVVEFLARLYDSPSRLEYCRGHWLDIVTCIPVIGQLRAVRLVRLLAFVRLGATTRSFGIATAKRSSRGGSFLWVVTPILLIVWAAASYGYYEVEGGVNPHINSFGDAMYFAFVTASTVGYGDVTPVTEAGKVLTGLLIFISIGLLGFASAQLTTKLLPQRNELADILVALERQAVLLESFGTRLDALAREAERRDTGRDLANDPILEPIS